MTSSGRKLTSFISESDNELYTQRWLVTNGDNRLNDRAERTNSQLTQEDQAHQPPRRPHGAGAREHQGRGMPPLPAQPRRPVAQAVQDLYAETMLSASAVSRLKGQLENRTWTASPPARPAARSSCPAAPARPASPCVSSRSCRRRADCPVVLCPSIALVAQIRREYLLNSDRPIRALGCLLGRDGWLRPEEGRPEKHLRGSDRRFQQRQRQRNQGEGHHQPGGNRPMDR